MIEYYIMYWVSVVIMLIAGIRIYKTSETVILFEFVGYILMSFTPLVNTFIPLLIICLELCEAADTTMIKGERKRHTRKNILTGRWEND